MPAPAWPPKITDTVYPMYKAFIEPDLRLAQLRIYNSFNPFAGATGRGLRCPLPQPPRRG